MQANERQVQIRALLQLAEEAESTDAAFTLSAIQVSTNTSSLLPKEDCGN